MCFYKNEFRVDSRTLESFVLKFIIFQKHNEEFQKKHTIPFFLEILNYILTESKGVNIMLLVGKRKQFR